MVRGSLLIISILFAIPSFSQISLEGVVMADSLGDSRINIINLSQKTGTTNLRSGEFQVDVKENDTLLFSSIQYRTVEVIITPLILKEGFLKVKLIDNINQLEEVQISNINLTGSLRQDLSQMKIYNQNDFGFPLWSRKPLTSIEKKLNTARGSPLITLLNTINGEIKMLKKAKEKERISMEVEKGIKAFPSDVFVEYLEIPEDQIKNFVYFCAFNMNFQNLLEGYRRLELLEYYRKKAPEFLSL